MIQKAIKNRLDILSPEYKSFVKSDFAQITTSFFAQKYPQLNERWEVFENGLLLYLLFYFSERDLKVFFVEECLLTPADAQEILDIIKSELPEDLITTISSTHKIVSQTEKEYFNNKSLSEKADQTNKKDSSYKADDVKNATLKPKPFPVSGKMASMQKPKAPDSGVAGMRTMRSDIDRLRGDEQPAATTSAPQQTPTPQKPADSSAAAAKPAPTPATAQNTPPQPPAPPSYKEDTE